jgi:hypothetical protein
LRQLMLGREDAAVQGQRLGRRKVEHVLHGRSGREHVHKRVCLLGRLDSLCVPYAPCSLALFMVVFIL